MTAAMVQRVVVRMMFDATFRQRVYENPELALLKVDLTAVERQWLIRPDPRAYGADENRASRALTSLLEEYLVAGALAIRQTDGVERLYRFFEADIFHQCIQERGSMAAAFGTYVASPAFDAQSDIGPIAVLEQTIASVRRAAASPLQPRGDLSTQSGIQLAPGIGLLSLPVRALPRYTNLLSHLSQYGGSRLEAVLDLRYPLPEDAPNPEDGPNMNAASEFIMIDGTSGNSDTSIEIVPDELGALLRAAQASITWEALCEVAIDLGAEPDEAIDIIQGLVDDHVLTLVRL